MKLSFNRKMKSVLGGILAGGILPAAVWAGPPELIIPECRTPPVIDGKTDDECWENSVAAKEYFELKSKGGAKSEMTAVKIARDGQWLYLAFDCRNPAMPRIEQECAQHDGPQNKDDSIEIFLDPGTSGECYYHYILTFANVRGERRVIKGVKDIAWNLPWRSATQVGSNGWTAELGLPLFALTEHGDPKDLRLNLARTLIDFTADGIGELTIRRRNYSSWAPVDNGFHEPGNFGYARGIDKITPENPFLPAIEQASVGRYEVRAAGMSYKVSGVLRAHSITPGSVAVAVIDRPLGGADAEFSANVALAGMQTAEFSLDVPVTDPVQRKVMVQLKNPQTGEILHARRIADTSRLTMMQAPLPDRNYYTDEQAARVLCRLGMPAEQLGGKRLAVRDGAGKELAGAVTLRAETMLDVPLAGMATGTHNLAAVLLDTDGRELSRQAFAVEKKAPHPAGEVKLDNWARVALKNNQPIFPFGMLFNSYGDQEYHVRHLVEAGMNTLVFWGGYADRDGLKLLLELAVKYNVHVLDNANYYVGKDCFNPGRLSIHPETVDARINAVKDHPALLGYYSVDEPNLKPDFNQVMDDCRLFYERVQALDGYHPVFMLYARGIPNVPQATAWADILGYDVYLTGGMGNYYASPNYMAGYTTFLDRRAAEKRQPVWMLPLAERLDPNRTPRGLLPEEHRSQAYLSVIHGARGILYYVYQQMSHYLTWQVFTELGREFRELAPALLNRMPEQSVAYEPGAYAPENNLYPDVQAALFKYPDGDCVLLAANSCMYPVNLTCSVDGLPDGDQAVEVMFADRGLAAKDKMFADRLDWCGTRAYRFALPDAGRPVAIKLSIQAHPEAEHKLPKGNPKLVADQARNWIPNASFEQNTLPGIPDFAAPYRVSRPAVGEPGSLWVMDDENPFHGRYAVRMTRDINRCWGMFFAAFPPTAVSETPYVLSMYMRGKDGGEKATIRLINEGGNPTPANPPQKSFVLTQEWQRYFMPVPVKPPKISWQRNHTLLIYPHEGATVWVDAIQFEQGLEPGEFTEE